MAGAESSPGERVTVIGAVQVDLLMSPVTDLPPGGTSLVADQMSMRLGGAGANAALAFAEAGVLVHLNGCIGDDHLGTWMRQELAPYALDGALVAVPGGRSGLTVALQSPERDRTFLTYLGVYADWRPEMIPAESLHCRDLLLCDYFMTPGLQGMHARQILETARGHGARTFFDTAWDPANFPPRTRDEVLGLLSAVDVFLPNEAEACALAGIDANGDRGSALAAAHVLHEASGGWVVVKLGPRGCLAVGPGGRELSAAAPRVQVADTTGAGDAFNAGLVLALSDGRDWPEALEAAARFASSVVARPSHERYRPHATRPAGAR